MNKHVALRLLILLGISVCFCCSCKQKQTILAGTDYLKTLPGTSFELTLPGSATATIVPFVGNPRSGNAYDTAIMRVNDVSIQPGESGTTSLQMTELSLKSDQPVTINGQRYNLLVTLDSGKQSNGTMTISEDGNAKGTGTFTSSFDQINFVVAFEPVGGVTRLPDLALSTSLVGNGDQELPCCRWISSPQQANPPCTVVAPKPKGARDTNQHTNKDPSDLDIFPNGQINENHNHTSRWHKAACI